MHNYVFNDFHRKQHSINQKNQDLNDTKLPLKTSISLSNLELLHERDSKLLWERIAIKREKEDLPFGDSKGSTIHRSSIMSLGHLYHILSSPIKNGMLLFDIFCFLIQFDFSFTHNWMLLHYCLFPCLISYYILAISNPL